MTDMKFSGRETLFDKQPIIMSPNRFLRVKALVGAFNKVEGASRGLLQKPRNIFNYFTG